MVQHLRGCWHLEIKNKHLPQVVHIPLFPHPCCLDLLSLGICYNGEAVTNTDRLNLLTFFLLPNLEVLYDLLSHVLLRWLSR